MKIGRRVQYAGHGVLGVGIPIVVVVGCDREHESFAWGPLCPEPVLVPDLEVTVVHVTISIIDQAVVVLGVGTQAADDHFVRQATDGAHGRSSVGIIPGNRSLSRAVGVVVLDRILRHDVDCDGCVGRLSHKLTRGEVAGGGQCRSSDARYPRQEHNGHEEHCHQNTTMHPSPVAWPAGSRSRVRPTPAHGDPLSAPVCERPRIVSHLSHDPLPKASSFLV